MVDIGKDYGASIRDIQVPVVTREMMVHAARVVFGMALDADDAMRLIGVIGLSDEGVLEEARSGMVGVL